MPTPDLSAMLRWPNVPACYGWLSLDRRGRWRLRGDVVTHGGLNDFLNRQYGHDQAGNYFVQNGPQRVFVELEYTPWVIRLTGEDQFETHVGAAVGQLLAAALDDEGNLLLEISDGVALLCDQDLPALRGFFRLPDGTPADDASVLAAMAPATKQIGNLTLRWGSAHLPVRSICRSEVARRYGFVASPQPVAPEELS